MQHNLSYSLVLILLDEMKGLGSRGLKFNPQILKYYFVFSRQSFNLMKWKPKPLITQYNFKLSQERLNAFLIYGM